MYDDENQNGAIQAFMRGPGGTVFSGVVITLVVAVVCGVVATFWNYVPRSRDSHYRRDRRMKHITEDTTGAMKGRFWAGAALGAALGAGGFIVVTKRTKKKH